MMRSDPYLVHNAFDDLPEFSQAPARARTGGVVPLWRRAASRSAQRRKHMSVVGSDLTSLRVDDPETYETHRRERCAPYVDELQRRLGALEKAVAAHVADNHGGGRLDELEREFHEHISDGHGAPVHVIGEAVVDAAVQARHGGVPVPVAAHLQGKVDCWQDGHDLCCTVRVLDGDGQVKCVTGTMPLAACIEDVVVGAAAVDVELDEFVEHAPAIARVVGGESLLAQVCGLLPTVTRPSTASAYLHGTEILISLHGRN